MTTLQEKRTVKLPHNLIMEDRKKLTITGVSQVDHFDDQSVVLLTDAGQLTIRGNDLHISQLNVDTGELNVTGFIYGLIYSDDDRKSVGFFSRLFK